MRRRFLATAVLTAALAAGVPTLPAPATAAPAAPARGEVYRVPANGVFTVEGHGWGHGHGMSQYGAYGAAKVRGLDYRQILDFYYPHTKLVGQPLTTAVRVLLHSAPSDRLVVAPRSGHPLAVLTTVHGVPHCVLPTDDGDAPIRLWRAKVVATADGVRLRLQATTDGTGWDRPRLPGCDRAWRQPLDGSITFDGGGVTDLALGSSLLPYRGRLRAAFTGSRIFAVNIAPLDDYLRSVVPSEMPASWSPAALQAQAVAARTYASYGMAHPKNRPYYDVYDDTRDQMYLGRAHEVGSTNAAVKATEDRKAGTADVLVDGQGNPAFTQFSSSDGGWTVGGGQPYLPAQRDPYDGLVPSSVHTWRSTVSASSVAAAYGSSIGTLRSIAVTGRDGNGAWGGRVTTVRLQGSAGDVDVSGTSFRYALGLRSEWFRVISPPPPPTRLTARRDARTVTVSWQPPSAVTGARPRGYRVTLQPGGATRTVAADATSVMFADVAPRDARTARVVTTSGVGPSWPATVTTLVHRLRGGSLPRTAVAGSAAGFGDGRAYAAVLVPRTAGAVAGAAAVLGAVLRGPVLVTGTDALPAVTERELCRVLPTGASVHLVGGAASIGSAVRDRLVRLGYVVTRDGGGNAAAVAARVADDVTTARAPTTVVEVDATDPDAAALGAPVATRRSGVVLLTGDGALPRPTARWLAAHPDVHRFAIGRAAAAADPAANPVTAAGAGPLSVAVADRFFHDPSLLSVATSGARAELVAAARSARRVAPVLLLGDHLTRVARRYVAGVARGIRRVDLVGGGMSYDAVETPLQRVLLAATAAGG